MSQSLQLLELNKLFYTYFDYIMVDEFREKIITIFLHNLRTDPSNLMLIKKDYVDGISNVTDEIEFNFPDLSLKSIYIIFENIVKEIFNSEEMIRNKIITYSKQNKIDAISAYIFIYKKKYNISLPNQNLLLFLLHFKKSFDILLTRLNIHNNKLYQRLNDEILDKSNGRDINNYEFITHTDNMLNEHNISKIMNNNLNPIDLIYNIDDVEQIALELNEGNIVDMKYDDLKFIYGSYNERNDEEDQNQNQRITTLSVFRIAAKKAIDKIFEYITDIKLSDNVINFEIEPEYKLILNNIYFQLYLFGLYISQINDEYERKNGESNDVIIEDKQKDFVELIDEFIDKLKRIDGATNITSADKEKKKKEAKDELNKKNIQNVKKYKTIKRLEEEHTKVSDQLFTLYAFEEKIKNEIATLEAELDSSDYEEDENENNRDIKRRQLEQKIDYLTRTENNIIILSEKFRTIETDLKKLATNIYYKDLNIHAKYLYSFESLNAKYIDKGLSASKRIIIAASIYIFFRYEKNFKRYVNDASLLLSGINILKRQNAKAFNLLLNLLYNDIEVINKNNMLLTTFFNNKIKIYK